MNPAQKLFTVLVSYYASQQGIVTAVELALLEDSRGARRYTPPNDSAVIFTIQALPYWTGITRDPFGPGYPSRDEVIAALRKHANVEVLILPVEIERPTNNQNLLLMNQWGARRATCHFHLAETLRYFGGDRKSVGTSQPCERCDQDLQKARHPGVVRIALTSANLSHTRWRDGFVYVYHLDRSSPTGVKLSCGCEEGLYNTIVAELTEAGLLKDRRGAVSPLSPTEGLRGSR